MGVERRRGSCADACEADRERGDGPQGLATPTVSETAIREETARSTQWKEPEEVFARVNQRVRGWIGYFHYANSSRVFGKMQWQMRERMRRWLWKKHAKTKAQYGRHYSDERLHVQHGLMRFPLKTKWRHMKQTEERHSESRMREIRPSGSMRGSSGAALPPSFAPYSTETDSNIGFLHRRPAFSLQSGESGLGKSSRGAAFRGLKEQGLPVFSPARLEPYSRKFSVVLSVSVVPNARTFDPISDPRLIRFQTIPIFHLRFKISPTKADFGIAF